MTESLISSVHPTVVKLLNSAHTPVSLCLAGSGGLVGSPEQDKKRILEKLVDALSLIYYPMPVSTTVLHVLITLLLVSYCWGRTIPGLCDKKNGPTSPFRLMSCPQMAAKPFFSSQSQCLPVDKCSPSVSKLSKHSRQSNSWIRFPFIGKLKL